MITETISSFCLRHKIIEAEDLPIFLYCIEKRFYSAIAFIPLFLCGIIWTNIATTLAFLCSFSYLRSTTNGFHTKKPSTCFIVSVLIELLLFKYFIPILTDVIVVITTVLSIVIVFVLAPYNHPNMDLSFEETTACRTESRKRLLFLLFLLLVSSVLSFNNIFIGLFLGIALVSVLLCLAYISNWEVLTCLTRKEKS